MKLFNIIGILSVFQLSMLTIVLIIKGNKKQNANYIFVSFLLVNIFLIVSSLLYNLGNLKNPVIILGSLTIFFLLGPLIYYFFRLTFYPTNKYNKYSTIHLIPLFFYTVYFTSVLLADKQPDADNTFPLNNSQFLVWCLLAYPHLLTYIIFSFRILKEYKTSLNNQNPNFAKNSLSWLNLLIYMYLFHWFFDTASAFLNFSGLVPYEVCIYISILSTICLLLFSTITVIKGMEGFNLVTLENTKPKYANSPLTENEKEIIKTSIITCIEKGKLYLEPELTIAILSDKIAIPVKSISQVINESFNSNFFDFVNTYRINESKQKILNNNGLSKPLTISEIMFGCGFNSKSAFNRAFKKQTGLTPTEFKQKHQINIQKSSAIS